MQTIHASAVAFDGAAILVLGPSGIGKSTLALELIGLGGCLVADDRVVLQPKPDGLWASAPEPLQDQIEARGIGILKTPSAPARVALAVDLTKTEEKRLPDPQSIQLAGCDLPLLYKVESPAFAVMLKLYLGVGPSK